MNHLGQVPVSVPQQHGEGGVKACWPNHMQTPHQRSATRHGGTELLPEPQAASWAHICQQGPESPLPMSQPPGRATGRPAQHHSICRGLLSKQHQECTFKRGSWGRELHSDPGRVLVQSSLPRDILYFVIFQNILCDPIQSPEQKLLKTSVLFAFFLFDSDLLFTYFLFLILPCFHFVFVYFTCLFNKCLSIFKIRVVSQTLLFLISVSISVSVWIIYDPTFLRVKSH